MKMKDYLKIIEENKKSLKEEENADVQLQAGKPVVKRTKRFTQESPLEFDEEQNFYKRDSGAEYTREMKTAQEIFDTIGIQDGKFSETFFNVFPKIDAKKTKEVKEAYAHSYNDCTPFLIEQDQNEYTLVNHDHQGTVYENDIDFDPARRRFMIETHDPETFNIVQNIGRGDRHKHALRSQELRFVMEFAQMSGKECWVEFNGNSARI